MALTPRRWIAALVITLLGLVAVLVPPGRARGFAGYLPWAWYVATGPGWKEPDSLHAEYNRLTQAASAVGDQVVLASWRDSVLRQTALIDRARRGGAQVYVAGLSDPSPGRLGPARSKADRPDPAMLLRIQAGLDSAWRNLPRRDSGAWTVVLLTRRDHSIPVSGAQLHLANLSLSPYYEPLIHGPPLGGGGCVLLLDAAVTALPVAPQLILDKLAPCWWRAAFGAPSDSINAWLQRQSWSSAYPIRWWLRGGWNEVQEVSGRHPQVVVADTGAWGDAAHVAVDWALSWGSLTAASCYRGNRESCQQLFRAPEQWGRRIHVTPPEEQVLAITRRRVAGGVLLAGLLRAVLDSVGPDRFQSFWTSQHSPDSALALALDRPVSPWLMARVERRLGGSAAPARPRSASVGVALLLASILAGVALLTTTRRQAG